MDIKKSLSILKGSYTITTPEGDTSAKYRLPKGKGFVILNLGIVKLGKECIKYDIDELAKPLENLQREINKLADWFLINRPDEIKEGSAVDNAIRLLSTMQKKKQ